MDHWIDEDGTELTTLFEMSAVSDLEKSESETEASEKDGRRFVAGYGTTQAKDLDEEEVLKKGMDYRPLRERGFVNYDHQRREIAGAKVPIIIGYPTRVEMREKGLFIESELLKGDPCSSEQLRLANEMWQLGVALKKAGGYRSLAYSIEGVVKERRGKKIVKSEARHVALTHKPVNPECSVEVFMKSLCCGKCSPGHPQYNPAHACGNKHFEFADGLPHLVAAMEKAMTTTASGPTETHRTSPLMRENLDRGIVTALYGDQPCPDHYDAGSGRFHKGIAGAYEHMTKCLGYDGNHSHHFLSRLLKGAGKSEEIADLTKAAGFYRR